MLQEMLDLDSSDHICARHSLLKCYMDRAEAENARSLIDKYPEDSSASFLFTKALIEHISLILEEPGASVTVILHFFPFDTPSTIISIDLNMSLIYKVRNGVLLEAHTKNPYVIWTLINHEAFSKKFDVHVYDVLYKCCVTHIFRLK